MDSTDPRIERFWKSYAAVLNSEPEVASFLEHLAINRKASGATQGQALNALVFFFARVLERPLGEIGPFKRPKRPKRLPTVLSPREIESLFAQ